MAGSASDYLENAILEHIVGKTSLTMPTAYLTLTTSSGTLNDASTGATITEPSYTGPFARKATTGSDWNTASGGSITNATTLGFPACSSGSATITGFALMDTSTPGTGHVLAHGTCSLSINAGITPQFAAGALTITMD
jgi:hypothetical protein